MMTSVSAMMDRADYYRILSRALMPLRDSVQHQLFVDELPALLEAFDAAFDLGAADDCACFRGCLSVGPSQTDLLVAYSGLFLSPPVRAPLNAAMYLDGAMMGRSVEAIEDAFAARGLGKAAGFRDMPDHLSVLTEFTGVLFALAAAGDSTAATDAGGFLRRFVQPWLPDCQQRIAQAGEYAAGPYLHLLRILERAVERDVDAYAPAEAVKTTRRRTRPEALIGKHDEAVGCSRCGAPYVREKQLAKLARVLQEQNLATDHLEICPDCRTAAMGFARMKQPSLSKRRRVAEAQG